MNASQVRLALLAWEALNDPRHTSFDAIGRDVTPYPRARHIAAWDIDAAIETLPAPLQRAARDLRNTGGDTSGETAQLLACTLIARHMQGESNV